MDKIKNLKKKPESKQQGTGKVDSPGSGRAAPVKKIPKRAPGTSESEEFVMKMIHGSPKTNPKMERKPLKLNIEKANAESDVAPSTPGPETPTAPGTPVGLHCGCFDLEWDSTSARSTKKRRLDEEDDEEEEREPRRGDRLKVKARELLTELREQVNELEKMTGAANFPNAELADKVAVIRSMVTNLVTEDVIQRVEGSVEARETTNLCRKCGERVDKEVQPGEIEKVTL
jgi:hypothetical protein